MRVPISRFQRVRLLLLGSLVGLLLMGCDLLRNGDSDRGEPVSYEQVEKAGGLHVRKAQTRVFRDSASWIQFWNKHVSAFDENHELISPPSVDFDRREIVAVFWGCFYGGCRRSVNAIEGIYNAGNQIEVSIGSLPDLGACRMVQLPLQVVSIPESEKPIDFTGKIPEQRYSVEKCSPRSNALRGNVSLKAARTQRTIRTRI